MVQEAVEVSERQSLESFLQDYDEKFRAGFEHAPKFIFRKIIDSSQAGLGPARVHDDFLPLLPLTKAKVAEGLGRFLRDRTNDILLEELWCLGFSESMGGFVILEVNNKRNGPRQIRKFEDWNGEDWQRVEGMERPNLQKVFNANLALAKAASELSQEAAQNNPGFNTESWNLLWD